MIDEIKSWAETIIVAIFASVIIEALLPNGNNRKYIKVIIGIYIMCVILTPLINIFNVDAYFDEKILKSNFNPVVKETSVDMTNVYMVGLEEAIKEDIKRLGYDLENVKIKLDKSLENIEQIELEGLYKTKNEIGIEQIRIGEDVGEDRYQDVFVYLMQNYFVSKDKVIIKN